MSTSNAQINAMLKFLAQKTPGLENKHFFLFFGKKDQPFQKIELFWNYEGPRWDMAFRPSGIKEVDVPTEEIWPRLMRHGISYDDLYAQAEDKISGRAALMNREIAAIEAFMGEGYAQNAQDRWDAFSKALIHTVGETLRSKPRPL